jgi:predicted acetyltransferase
MAEQTGYRVVPVTASQLPDVHRLDDVTWFGEPDPDELHGDALDLTRTYAATRTGEPPYSGVYSSFDQLLTVPAPGGGLTQVPCAGLTWVGVHPDERRRGVLSTMLRHHLDDLHAQGCALGSLHASEVGIYGRFGYGQASFGLELTAGGGAEVDVPGVDTTGIRTELVATADEGVAGRAHTVQLAVAGRHLGHVTLTEAHNRARFRDTAMQQRGTERARALFAVRDGVDLGYAMFRRTQRWDQSLASGSLRCWDLTTAEPAARLALLRRLVGFDLVSSVSLPAGSLDDEVIWWLGGPRAVRARVHDALWVRVLDVPAALTQRGWAADVDVVLEVADERCPWNAGRWRLVARDGAASCEPTTADAGVRLPVEVLGSAYLGGRSLAAMATQGLVTELSPGSVSALARAFATDRPPSAALMF